MNEFVYMFILLIGSAMAQRGCDSFFRDMEDAQNKLLQQMKSSTSKERNDALLERFHKEYSQQLISFDEERMRRCGYLDSQYGNATASFKKLLKQCNLKLREEEGTLYLSFDENALFKKFSKDISEEYMLYLWIMSSPERMFSDASVVVPWTDLGKLVYVETEFIRGFPNSKRRKEIIDSYAYHLYFFLMGTDNSPSAQNAQAQNAIRQFAKEYPNSIATPIVNAYITNKNKMNESRLASYISKEITKQTGTTIYNEEYGD